MPIPGLPGLTFLMVAAALFFIGRRIAASPEPLAITEIGALEKKKQDQDNSNNSGNSSGQSSSNSGSLMDMQTEVTSYSSNSLDKGLFEVPAGFTQVQRDPDEMLGGRKK